MNKGTRERPGGIPTQSVGTIKLVISDKRIYYIPQVQERLNGAPRQSGAMKWRDKMNKPARIQQLLDLIPDDSENEALMAIQSIQAAAYSLQLQLSCHLSHKFVVVITAERVGHGLTISANGRKSVACTDSTLLTALKRYIYELDEAISEGFIPPKKIRDTTIPNYPAPANMDIPVWDDVKKCWYDAEY